MGTRSSAESGNKLPIRAKMAELAGCPAVSR